jgi:2-oxoglutarate dehydrogenase E2 component (dihydrolipoamide succinyltransferase)
MPFRLICRSSLRVAHLAARSPSQAAALAAISRSRCFPNYRFASTAIVVPEMAESITEGTLKQFSKKVGDRVEIDEEIATIETDKVHISSTLPSAHPFRSMWP